MLKYRFQGKIVEKAKIAFLPAVAYALLFYFPRAIHFFSAKATVNNFLFLCISAYSEITIASLLTFLIFLLSGFNRFLLYSVVAIFYAVGGVTVYLIINFSLWSLKSIIQYEPYFIAERISRVGGNLIETC